MLRKYPEIEKSHFKLWIGSTSILEKILNRGVVAESQIQEKQLKEKLKVYVNNRSFEDTRKFLDDKNFCIISGEPGVGKTTLAEMLCLYYIGRGYNFFKISSNIQEGYRFLNSRRQTIFYYDDFLGMTFLENHLEKNEDSTILKFFHEVSRNNKTHKMILTTREYVLQQAYSFSERFSQSSLDINKYILKLDKYSDCDKAHILYNHLLHSDIDKVHIENFVKRKTYLKVVRHKNFNPRLIETMTEKSHLDLQGITSENYSEHFISNLDNPKSIWEYAFKKLSPFSQHLILSIASFRGGISVEKLEEAYNYLRNKMVENSDNDRHSYDDFKKALRESERSFISYEKGKNEIRFTNPSVNDFMENHFKENLNLMRDSICFSIYPSQVERFFLLSSGNKVFEKILTDTGVQEKILEITGLNSRNGLNFESIFSSIFKLDLSKGFIKKK